MSATLKPREYSDIILLSNPFILVFLLGTICGSKSAFLSLGTDISKSPVSVVNVLVVLPLR